MNFLLALLGALLGIIIAVGIIVFIVYWKIRSAVGYTGMKIISHAISHSSDIERDEYKRAKNVKRGLTSLLEPEILRDFPDFNKDLLFSICEKNLRKILNAIESQDDYEVQSDDNFIYIRDKISEQIVDMKSNNTYEKFDNIEFHKHAISAYSKKNGKATIEISTTLNYYYETNRQDKKSFPDIKKETRYLSEFVYVYDETQFKEKQISFSIHCPNCGAPLRHLGYSECEYCGAYIEKLNLKVWKMSSCNEDY